MCHFLLQDYPLEQVLCGPFVLNEWRPDLIEQLLADFIPDNIRVAIIAKQFEGTTKEVEPWYGTHYTLEKIPEEKLQVSLYIQHTNHRCTCFFVSDM